MQTSTSGPQPGAQLPPRVTARRPRKVLNLAGDLDQQSAGSLRRTVQDLPPGSRLVVDLAEVPFVDSIGVGALIGAIRTVHDRGGSVTIASPSDPVAHLLRITGVSDLAPVIHASPAAGPGLPPDRQLEEMVP